MLYDILDYVLDFGKLALPFYAVFTAFRIASCIYADVITDIKAGKGSEQ